MTRPVLSLALLLPGQVLAATLNVPGQYPTLASAVSFSSDGDTIVMAPGDYSAESPVSIVGRVLSIVGSAPDEVTLPPIYLDRWGQNIGDLSLSAVGLACRPEPAVQAFTGNLRLSNVVALGCTESRPTIDLPNNFGDVQQLVIEDSLFEDLESRTFGAIRAKGAEVVISNTRFDNVRSLVGILDADCPSDSCGGAIAARDSNLTVTDSSFVDCSAGEGGAISFYGGTLSGARLDIIASDFSGNSTSIGGALQVQTDGEVNIVGSTFTNNSTLDSGAAIGLQGTVSLRSDVLIDGCDFVGNTAFQTGGAIRGGGVNGLTIRNSRFEQNAASAGGALAATVDTDMRVEGTDFVSNSSLGSGGAVYVDVTGNISLDTCSFVTNTASGSGGGVWVQANSMDIGSSSFDLNEADDGGALSTDLIGDGVIADTSFVGNSALIGGGGALQLTVGGSADLDGTTFSANTGADQGGAAVVQADSLNIAASGFDLNSAASGGALYALVGQTIAIDGSNFVGNSATVSGGGALVISSGSAVSITGSDLSDNSAVTDGGGLWYTGLASVRLEGTSLGNNQAANGGAVAFDPLGVVSLIVEEAQFTGNSATFLGGGVHLPAGGLAQVRGAAFCGNAAGMAGSDLSAGAGLDLRMDGSWFALNDGPSSTSLSGSSGNLWNLTYAGTDAAAIEIAEVAATAVIGESLFLDLGSVGVVFGPGTQPSTGSRNAIWPGNTPWQSGGMDLWLNDGAISADPMVFGYVDRNTTTCADIDLRLQAGSALRDQGDPSRVVPGSGTSIDPDGSTPDIGAFGGLWSALVDGDSDGFFEDLDCDDADDQVFPGAPEVPYDGLDQDCDGLDATDLDNDGEDAQAAGGLDCNDANPGIHTGATEVWYDGIDQNCDGNDLDQDGDGEDSEDYGGTDCDDTDPAIYVGAPEVWYDDVDQDCLGGDDFDQDGDGFASADFVGVDCDDTDPTVNPDAVELWYDGIDQDCDGNDLDQDGDGFDSAEYGGDDCDDEDVQINPDAFEDPTDGIDSDCDGTVEGGEDTDQPDSPTPEPPDLNDEKGCGCSSGSGSAGWGLIGLGALLLRRRR